MDFINKKEKEGLVEYDDFDIEAMIKGYEAVKAQEKAESIKDAIQKSNLPTKEQEN